MVAAPQSEPPQATAPTYRGMAGIPRIVAWFVFGAVGLLALALLAGQLVPYGRAHSNPPVVQEPSWDGPQTRALFARACNDCHSNQTDWSQQSTVAPLSWLTQWAVDEGRSAFNVSEWPSGVRHASDVAGSVQKGQMPPEIWLSLHPDARLTPDEQQTLIRGLRATFGAEASTRGH